MSRSARFVVLGLGAVGLALAFAWSFSALPGFGSLSHPYRDAAVESAVAHHTANVVSSVNFDLRGFDTLGEETIMLASVVGVAALLRTASSESPHRGRRGRELQSTRLMGYVILAATLVVGFNVVAHGHLTPGGGFQGGVVLATGFHLLYLAGSYPALERLRPLPAFEAGEALGALAFAGLGVAGTAVSGAFLANVAPSGAFAQLFSSGSVALLNCAVGLEVASGTIVLLAKFLDQAVKVES